MKSAGSYSKLIRQSHFFYYLVACFFGALNDNAYKMVVTLIALNALKSGQVDIYFISAQIVFTAPFLLFSGVAGFLADKFSKKSIIIATKLWEVVVMLLICFALPYKNRSVLVAILFLLTTQSVFFSPAKYAIMPELFKEDDLSRANGLLELTTFVGIILGSAVGGILINYLADYLFIIGLVILGFSLIGTFASFKIKPVLAAASHKKFSLNPFDEIKQGIEILKNNNVLVFVILGISMFFALALGATTNLTLYGREQFGLSDAMLALLNVAIGLGVGTGSFASGWLSGDKIEPSLIPLGVIAAAGSFFGIYFSHTLLYLFLFVSLAGFFTGIFVVPLNAMLQDIPAKEEKGRLVATNNFFNGISMISIILLLWFFMAGLHISSSGIMLILSILASGYAIVTIKFCPEFFSRTLLWFITHILYRIETVGVPDIPYKGGALIVANQASFLDGLLLSIVFPRTVHCVVPAKFFKNKLLKFILKSVKSISFTENANKILKEHLLSGKVVCLFVDNHLDAQSECNNFAKDFAKLTSDFSDLPIAPVYIEQLWDGDWSDENKSGWLGHKLFTRVTVSIGDVVNVKNIKAWQIRQKIGDLSVVSNKIQKIPARQLGIEFLSNNRLHPWRFCGSDLYGNKWSYGKFIDYCLLTVRELKKHHQNEQTIALFMPPSFDNILLNVVFNLLGKKIINLPLKITDQDLKNILLEEKVRTIYTNSELLKTKNLSVDSRMIFWEDLNFEHSTKDRILVFFLKFLLPSKFLVKIYGDYYKSYDSSMVVFDKNFSTLKLSQQEVYSNIFSVKQVLRLRAKDRFSCLHPFSSSFSYMCNLWLPLVIGSGLICNNTLYNNKSIIKQLYKSKVTVLLDNSRGYKSYYKLASSRLFARLKYSIVMDGGILTEDFLLEFCRRLHCNLLLGSIISNINSIISFNVPSLVDGEYKLVGHVLPNVSVRIVDENNRERDLGSKLKGILQVKTATASEKWFDTNISAMIDNNGLLYF